MDLHMITTTDNPYSPVTDYYEWLAWDQRAGYYSNNLLARVVYSSHELSEADQAQAIEDGIDVIVTENASGVHAKVRAGTLALPTGEPELIGDESTESRAA